jgi:aflatoxin B1 aldehyde reductase
MEKALDVTTEYEIGGYAAALRWVTHHRILKSKHPDGVLIGASSVSQTKKNLDALEQRPLPDTLWNL